MTPEEREATLRRLEASGLRGRGGAAYETWRKWRAVLAEEGVPLVVANGGESEPGSVKDRFLMRTRPHDVVTGLRLAIETLGAERGYIYLKGSFTQEEKRLDAAVRDADLASLITVHRGEDTYVGGEETALLESIEGRVAWPRPKPPRPSAVGLFGRPTLVQNVDTLVRVEAALKLGKDFPAQDTISVTLWGDVKNPGVVAVNAGRTLRSVIEREGGGSPSGIGLVFPNGAHSMPLGEPELDVPFEQGWTSVLVLGRDADPSSIVESIARFFEREACGQCPPCVLGTTNLRQLVTGERPATIRLTPHAAIRETASFMSIHGYCGHARAGATAVTGLFARFEADVMSRLRGVDPPPPLRPRDPFARDSEERRALEAFIART